MERLYSLATLCEFDFQHPKSVVVSSVEFPCLSHHRQWIQVAIVGIQITNLNLDDLIYYASHEDD